MGLLDSCISHSWSLPWLSSLNQSQKSLFLSLTALLPLTFLLSFCTSPLWAPLSFGDAAHLHALLWLLHILSCPLRPWSDCRVGFRLSSISSSTSYSIFLFGASLTLHVLWVRHHGERNYTSPSQSGCQKLFTLVTAQKILSAVASFCSSSSVHQETSPPQEWRTSLPLRILFLPWVLGTSCGSFRPYIIDLSKSWPDVSTAAVWFIMPFLRTDILEILNLAGPLPDNKVLFFYLRYFFISSKPDIKIHPDICSQELFLSSQSNNPSWHVPF